MCDLVPLLRGSSLSGNEVTPNLPVADTLSLYLNDVLEHDGTDYANAVWVVGTTNIDLGSALGDMGSALAAIVIGLGAGNRSVGLLAASTKFVDGGGQVFSGWAGVGGLAVITVSSDHASQSGDEEHCCLGEHHGGLYEGN